MPKLRSEAHIIGTGKRQNDQKRGFLARFAPILLEGVSCYPLSARARSRWLQGSAFPSPCFFDTKPRDRTRLDEIGAKLVTVRIWQISNRAEIQNELGTIA